MSDYVLPGQKKPKLIVVVAFDRRRMENCSPPTVQPISKARIGPSERPRD